MTIETLSGVKELTLYTFSGSVGSVSVNMGKVELDGKLHPVHSGRGERSSPARSTSAAAVYSATLVNVGNPHCVVFCEKVDAVDVRTSARSLNMRVLPAARSTRSLCGSSIAKDAENARLGARGTARRWRAVRGRRRAWSRLS